MTFEQIRQYIKGVINGIDFNSHISPMPAEDMAEVASPMPSVMSRRFKYSTEEQLVGEWIDGKPIYQKVIASTLPNQSHGDVVLATITDEIDVLIKTTFIATLYNDSKNLSTKPDAICQFWCTDGHNIEGYTRNTYSSAGYLILQYTKTTD